MPASPRPRRLHHWGSNALIYIAQKCTTRGLRCLHLHVQEHNSRCARLRRCPRRRELKKMPASPRHARVQGIPASPRHVRVQGIPASASLRASKRILASATSYARLPMARVKDARVGHIIPASAFTRVGQRWPRLLRRVQRCTRRLLLAPKMAASEVVTEFETWSCCLHLSSHVLPHNEEQREEGVWL